MIGRTICNSMGTWLLLGLIAVSPGMASVGQDASELVSDVGSKFNGRLTAMVTAPDGSGDIYIAGEFSSYRGRPVRSVVRLHADGTLDETFRLARGIGARIAAATLADDASGDLYVTDYGVEAAREGGWRLHSTVWRIHPDGTKDVRFTPAVFQREDAYVPDARFVPVVTALASVGSGAGDLYAAGRFGVVRLARDGSRDPDFRYTSSAFHIVPAKDGSGALYVSTNERIAPSGRHASQRVIKLKSDGTTDPSFDAGQGVAPHWSIFTIVPVEDGSGDLFIGGNFAGFNEANPRAAGAVRLLARLNPDGSLDRTSPRPRLDERHGAVMALARTDDGSGDWLVMQGHEVLRYSAEGARIEFAGGSAAEPVTSASAASGGLAER